MNTIVSFIKSMIKACPYTLAGKKCIAVVKGKKQTVQENDNKTARLKKGMKTGRNISLVGIFCPFFWYSLLTGMSTNFIILNAIHSALFILLGLFVMLVNYLILLNHKRKATQ